MQQLFPLRTVVFGAFVPTLIYEAGVGALLPVIPALATDRGASLTIAGLIAALLPIGKILSDVPAGVLSARVGDRRAMMLAGVAAAAAYLGIVLSGSIIGLALGTLALGGTSAVYNLARQSYLTAVTAPLRRARALSTLAGFHRIGLFIGPFLGAAAIGLAGAHGAVWVGLATAALTIGVLAAVGPDRATALDGRGVADGPATEPTAIGETLSIGQLARRYQRLFTTLGFAVLLVSLIRGARQNVLPLWGTHIGLDPATTSLLAGISGAVDMLLFYPSGLVMDRRGRLWIAVPSMVTMAIALALIPTTSSAVALGLVGVLLGIGNGMGSGIVMTLGADTAPADNRPRFLAVWRLFQDTGDALGPVLLAAGAAAGSLAGGVFLAAASGIGAAAALIRWAPRYSPLAMVVPLRRSRRPGDAPDPPR